MPALVALCAVFFVLRGWPPPVFFDEPEAWFEGKTGHLHTKVRETTGLLHVWSFDEAVPRDLFGGPPMLHPGTVLTHGRFGGARKFDGDDKTFIATPMRWSSLGDTYTIALWVLVKPRLKSQDIMWGNEAGVSSGFRLDDGVVCFDLPMADGSVVTLSAPFKTFNQFVHLAVTVDDATHTATLYVGGEPMDESVYGQHRPARHRILFGRAAWFRCRHPFHGVLDETTIWERALPASEIARLSQARHGMLRELAPPKTYARWRFQEFRKDLMGALGRAVYFGSLGDAMARDASPIPTVNLVLTGEDRRHFIRAHRRSRLSGRRTDAAANPRTVRVSTGSGVHTAHLRLLGTNLDYADSVRPSYLLEVDGGKEVLGLRHLALVPPESCGWLDPLVTSELNRTAGRSAVSNGLCRLRINGQSIGTYVFSDHSRLGVLPGELPEAADSLPIKSIQEDGSLFHRFPWPAESSLAAARLWPFTTNELLAVYDRVSTRAEGMVRNDPRNPVPAVIRRDILAQRRATAPSRWPTMPEDWSAARKAVELLDEFYVLGDNLSPQRIIGPLSLDAASKLPGGVAVTWKSSDPTWLDDAGIPSRPAEGCPRAVEMTAEVSDGIVRLSRQLSFRIMPSTIALPTLSLFVNQYVNKAYRIDGSVGICAAGEDRTSRFMLATQATGGGISHRGNTGYLSKKKMFTLETDSPHGLFGDNNRRFILSINALQDSSMICNSLAFDLFRSFGTPGSMHIAPRVVFAEVYVNGRYFGLHELCTRVDETLMAEGIGTLSPTPPGGLDEPQWIFFRSTVLRPRVPEMTARRPGPKRGNFNELYTEIDRWMNMPPAPEWIAQVPMKLDLTNFMDFQIILSLFQNRNGYPFHFQFHEIFAYSEASKRFFYVPWDFDLAFRGESWTLMENDAYRKLKSGYPEYEQLLAKRWRELRRGPLATETFFGEIDRLARLIEGYAEWDELRWTSERHSRHQQEVERVRAEARRYLTEMDRFFSEIQTGELP